MKFLCVPCDEPMKLAKVSPVDRGSVTVVFSCPACGYETAMLTNPFETQMVASLGVKIGGGAEGEAAAASEGSKCPFSAMIPRSDESSEVVWTSEAAARLTSIPEFVRPMARTGIEKFAKERGYREVDEKVLDEARGFFGM